MTTRRILLAEDEDLSRNILEEMLQNMGFEVTSAENGKVALDLFNNNYFDVVITDIDMPVMDGNELIAHLNEKDHAPTIIVQTVHDDLSMVINTMKQGVYDYIIKPVAADKIKHMLNKAFEYSELKRTNEILRFEKVKKLEDQLEWVKWNESFLKRDYDRIDSALFRSLHTSFNQGAGFGALLTLVQLFVGSGEKQGDKYLVDGQLYELVKESSILAQNTIDIFAEINTIFNSKFKLKRISLQELHVFIGDIVKKSKKASLINKNEVLYSDIKHDFKNKYVSIEDVFLGKAVKELITNAMKFSRTSTRIVVIIESDKDNATITVINSPDKDDKGNVGIPPEYENIIFEPFFRMKNIVYEQFDTIDYGLGLTTVSKIVTKHNGTITVSNIKDSSNIKQEPEIKVNFTISLPLT